MLRVNPNQVVFAVFCAVSAIAVAGTAGIWVAAAEETPAANRPGVLMITVDDMNFDSLGVTGCPIPDITPNIDKLAADGLRFEHAHVTIAVCQPTRSVWMTGRYPHRNGALGFQPINRDVPTLQESLRKAGYFTGIMAKVPHLAPADKFPWDVVVRANQLGVGRNPRLYYEQAKRFFEQARAEGKPFFLMANSQDPHRPFAGSEQERRRARGNPNAKNKKRRNPTPFPEASRYFKPKEAVVPDFLPDIPDVRQEMAEYFTSVHRADEIVGAVLRALDETGFRDETLVMFMSDHGMPLPFAKTNCYLNSTRTPWIVRWPGVVKPGTLDREHMISGIDFMPTVLEAAGLPPVEGMDGQSFLPLLRGGKQAGREELYTVFHRTSARRDYPMRSVLTRKFGYIYNAWSDGKTVFRNESQNGLTFRAMQRASQNDPEIAARVKLFQYRVPEEFYDYENDPAALHNLIDDPKYRDQIQEFRSRMHSRMKALDDPLLETFQKQVAGGG